MDNLTGLDAYLTRADDDLPSGDGRKVKPLMLHCSCGAVLPVSDAAQPHIAAGHKLTGRNGQVQQFSESWRTKPLNTTPKPFAGASPLITGAGQSGQSISVVASAEVHDGKEHPVQRLLVFDAADEVWKNVKMTIAKNEGVDGVQS